MPAEIVAESEARLQADRERNMEQRSVQLQLSLCMFHNVLPVLRDILASSLLQSAECLQCSPGTECWNGKGGLNKRSVSCRNLEQPTQSLVLSDHNFV